MSEPAKLFRVEEVTERGVLPAGRYLFAVGSEIMMDVDLPEPMRPRDLKPVILKAFGQDAEGGDHA